MPISVEAAVAQALKVPGWITPAECSLLASLAAEVGPGRVILEIGCYCGRSTLALALPTNALVVSIDSYAGGNESPIATWLSATRGLHNVLLWRADSREALRHWGVRLAGLVVDGDHDEDVAREDLFGFGNWCDGWIAAHDYASPGVRAGIDLFLSAYAYLARAEVVWAFQVLRRRAKQHGH